MWLMGAILIWFTTSQGNLNVERIFSNPPQQVQKEINDMGPDVARQLFRFQSSQLTRRIQETWEIVQLGLAGALLAASILTGHRSRIVIVATLLMVIFTALEAFYYTPLMTGLARSYDFLPATAALRERENFQSFQTWHRLMEVMKGGLSLMIIARLMFDFYDFGTFVIPWNKPSSGGSGSNGGRRRRRRRSSGSASGTSAGTRSDPRPDDAAATDTETSAELPQGPVRPPSIEGRDD